MKTLRSVLIAAIVIMNVIDVAAQQDEVKGRLSYQGLTKQVIEYIVEKPDFDGRVLPGQPIDNFKLQKISSRKNDTSNKDWLGDSDWYEFYNLIPTVGRCGINEADLILLPQQYKQGRLFSCCEWGGYLYAYYGDSFGALNYLVISDGYFNPKYALDFSSFIRAPKSKVGEEDFVLQSVRRAVVVDSILYVQHGHRTYASSSCGQNAYISAIDLNDNALLWTSEPLTCNSRDFIIVDNTIICGYGFTAEDDYLYLLDMATGQRRQRIKVASAPELIEYKDGRVFVRTYDTDYVFEIVPTGFSHFIVERSEEIIPYQLVDMKPVFRGETTNDFIEWINQRLDFPSEVKNSGLQGKVIFQVVIRKDGRVTDVSLLRGVNPIIDNEVLRVARMSPSWIPARHEGRKANVSYTCFIGIKL